jgi:hypothetical protein
MLTFKAGDFMFGMDFATILDYSWFFLLAGKKII